MKTKRIFLYLMSFPSPHLPPSPDTLNPGEDFIFGLENVNKNNNSLSFTFLSYNFFLSYTTFLSYIPFCPTPPSLSYTYFLSNTPPSFPTPPTCPTLPSTLLFLHLLSYTISLSFTSFLSYINFSPSPPLYLFSNIYFPSL